jgi:hypothetical protein
MVRVSKTVGFVVEESLFMVLQFFLFLTCHQQHLCLRIVVQ